MTLRKKEIIATLAIILLFLVSYNGYPQTIKDLQPHLGLQVDDTAAQYRQLLSTVNPLDRLPHSKTLGVASRIYLIGLPNREDRRNTLHSLEKAMDITFTWHNATYQDTPTITEIPERIRQVRAESRKGHEKELEQPDSFPFAWPDDVTSDSLLQPDDISGSELWFLPPSSPLALPPLPAPPVPDTRPQESVLWGDNNPNSEFPLKPVEIACWHSHFEVLRKIADGDDDVAIILEDDIDMEWDLERRLRYVWQFLPERWDQVWLGHCLSDPTRETAVTGTTYIYPSEGNYCTHAYAVSKKSAARLVRLLRNPLFAYSRPIDHAYIHLASKKYVKHFSLHPPPIIQSGITESDVSGMGSGGYFLMDSALERVKLWEAHKQV